MISAMKPTMQRLARGWAKQSGRNIERGDAGGKPIPKLDWPRLDGSWDHPLRGKGSLVHSLSGSTFYGDGTISAAIKADHPGALHLLLGTTGKGGSLPPVRSTSGGGMIFLGRTWQGQVRMVHAHEVNFKPRNFLQLDAQKTQEVVAEAAG